MDSYHQIFIGFILIFIIYHVQGQSTPDGNTTIPTNITVCPNGRNISEDPNCLNMKNDLKPTRNTGRRVTLILLACLLTVVLVASFLVVYRQSHRNSSTRTPPESSNPTGRNRLNNILRSIGLNNLNQRGRWNFFSRSPNTTNPSNQRQQTAAALNDNPDEALLFDDPYADGGLTNSSVNPYKSLTLAVT